MLLSHLCSRCRQRKHTKCLQLRGNACLSMKLSHGVQILNSLSELLNWHAELDGKILVELNAFVDIGVDREGSDPKAVYARVAREIFDDGIVHSGRIVAFFALTIYFQRLFDIELEKEVFDFGEEFLPD